MPFPPRVHRTVQSDLRTRVDANGRPVARSLTHVERAVVTGATMIDDSERAVMRFVAYLCIGLLGMGEHLACVRGTVTMPGKWAALDVGGAIRSLPPSKGPGRRSETVDSGPASAGKAAWCRKVVTTARGKWAVSVDGVRGEEEHRGSRGRVIPAGGSKKRHVNRSRGCRGRGLFVGVAYRSNWTH